jgi:hypothetical protein
MPPLAYAEFNAAGLAASVLSFTRPIWDAPRRIGHQFVGDICQWRTLLVRGCHGYEIFQYYSTNWIWDKSIFVTAIFLSKAHAECVDWMETKQHLQLPGTAAAFASREMFVG